MAGTRTFLDFAIDGSPLGRVVFELYSVSAPKTCENFRTLCTGEKGISPISELPMYFKDSIIHRSIADFMIQGGDFTKRNGTGGESIYGGVFADEDLSRPLDSAGLLCMANKGPNTNGSQFFITLRDCPHLNGKHVVFGKVIRGFEVVTQIAEVPVDAKSRPTARVAIVNCGELELRKKPVEPRSEPDGGSSGEEVRKERKKRDRSRSVSHSRTPEPSPKQHKKKKDKKRHEERLKSASGTNKTANANTVPGKETEEEYDARLEREEQERIEARKARQLTEITHKYADAQASEGGVRFKGRGRMRYVDPEMRRDDD